MSLYEKLFNLKKKFELSFVGSGIQRHGLTRKSRLELEWSALLYKLCSSCILYALAKILAIAILYMQSSKVQYLYHIVCFRATLNIHNAKTMLKCFWEYF